MLPEIDLPIELSKLKAIGWIESKRRGDTGIGKTIEDYLGIKENNLGEPDCLYHKMEVEIKSRRIKTSSMITLFTLEPGLRYLNDVQLMMKYGYTDSKGRQALKITLTPYSYTRQGLKLEVDEVKGTIAIIDVNGYRPWIWTTSDIHLKLHNLCIVYADSRILQGKEYFCINRAILASGLDDRCFFSLVAKGLVKIDLRMHIKETGASRNHGTAFRILNYENLVNCYEHQETIVS